VCRRRRKRFQLAHWRLPARVIARKNDVHHDEHHPRQHNFPPVLRFGWEGNDREHFGVICVVQAKPQIRGYAEMVVKPRRRATSSCRANNLA
jgi:hypothetical protein